MKGIARTEMSFPFLVNGNAVRLVDAADFTMKMMADDREVVTIRMGKMDIKKGDLVVFVPEQKFVDFSSKDFIHIFDEKDRSSSFLSLKDSILAQATNVFYKPLNRFTLDDIRGQDVKAGKSMLRSIHRGLAVDMNHYYEGVKPTDIFTGLAFTRLSPLTNIQLLGEFGMLADVRKFAYAEPLRSGMRAKLPDPTLVHS
jgi:hypothetical protein